jgi:hypothetical protein
MMTRSLLQEVDDFAKAAELAALLSEGLDLCVRARKIDGIGAATKGPMTRSGTLPLWVQDQFDKDLADWEKRGRATMMRLGFAR